MPEGFQTKTDSSVPRLNGQYLPRKDYVHPTSSPFLHHPQSAIFTPRPAPPTKARPRSRAACRRPARKVTLGGRRRTEEWRKIAGFGQRSQFSKTCDSVKNTRTGTAGRLFCRTALPARRCRGWRAGLSNLLLAPRGESGHSRHNETMTKTER